VECNSEDKSATVTMSIPASYVQTSNLSKLSFILDGGVEVVGVVVDPPAPTTSTTTNKVTPRPQRSDVVLPVTAVSAVALLLLTVILALVLAIYITKW